MLQEIPLVLSLAVFVCYILDLFKIQAVFYVCPIFGFSFYMLLRLYIVARKLYVSRWSRVLYVMLIVLTLFNFIDNMFFTPDDLVLANQITTIIFVSGTFSSFITFLYGKFQDISK